MRKEQHVHNKRVKVKVKEVCTGSHRRALRKGSQLVLTLVARSPPKDLEHHTWSG